jgi:hypothetical protein
MRVKVLGRIKRGSRVCYGKSKKSLWRDVS